MKVLACILLGIGCFVAALTFGKDQSIIYFSLACIFGIVAEILDDIDKLKKK